MPHAKLIACAAALLATFPATCIALDEWLPHVEPFVLAGTGHLLHVKKPTQLATALSSFFSRHSSGVAT